VIPSGGLDRAGASQGPHLHFGVRWQGAYLEPSTLLGLWRKLTGLIITLATLVGHIVPRHQVLVAWP
jgi:hypothetical protein